MFVKDSFRYSERSCDNVEYGPNWQIPDSMRQSQSRVKMLENRSKSEITIDKKNALPSRRQVQYWPSTVAAVKMRLSLR